MRRFVGWVAVVLVAAVALGWLGAASARAVESTEPPCDLACEMGQVAVEIQNGLGRIASDMGQALADGFGGVLDGINGGVQRLLDGLSGIGEALGRMQDGVLQGIAGAAQGIADAIHGLQEWWEGLGDRLTSGISGIGDKLSEMWDGLRGLLGGLGDKLDGLLGGFSCADGRCDHGLGELGADIDGLRDRARVDEWTGVAGGYVDKFNGFAGCSCSVAQISLGGWHGPLLNFCSGDFARLAAISKVGTRVILMVGALAASIRFVMAGLSYVGFIDQAQKNEQKATAKAAKSKGAK